jgi:hypothetical protein
MALHEKTRAFGKSPAECYQALLALLPQLGYRIVRRRDIAWLILAEKPGEKTTCGTPVTATITCRPVAPTQVTIACEIRASNTDDEEKLAVEDIFDRLSARLT